MAFPQGIYFRATDDQTDPTDYDAEISSTADYPWTTAQGNTVGWEQSLTDGGVADRNATTDVRLKGVAFLPNNRTPPSFRIDLPATGDYKFRAALGDSAFDQTEIAELFDGTTSLGDVCNAALGAAGRWYDATGVLRTSEADWVSNNALTAATTFATQICRLKIGRLGSAGFTTLAAFYIEAATGGGTTSGTSAATSGATGTLTGTGALSGTSAATSGATGALANGAAGSLTGTSAATSGATATLTAIGALIGSSQIVSGATGTLIDAIGHLSGTIAASSGATGTLRDGTSRTSIMGTAQIAPPLAQIWADFDEDARL